MIYACLPFLREWASPLTVVNYMLLGCASGFTLAAALRGRVAPGARALLRGLGADPHAARLREPRRVARPQCAACGRSRRCRRRSASSIRGSCRSRRASWAARSTRASSSTAAAAAVLRSVKWLFLLRRVRRCPPLLLAAALAGAPAPCAACAAFVVQYVGLLAERWFFFAQANHPQNLYYQAVG